MPTASDTIALGSTQPLFDNYGNSNPQARAFDLGDGRVLTTWAWGQNPYFPDPNFDDTYDSVYFMIHDLEGNPLAGPALLDPDFTPRAFPANGPQLIHAVTPDGNGGIVVHYGVRESLYPAVMTHYATTITAQGDAQPAVGVPSNTQYITATENLVLSNGNAAMVSTAGLTVIDQTGAIVGTSGGYGNTDDWSLVETADGRLLVVTSYGATASGVTNIKGQFFDLNASPLGEEFDIAGPPETPTYNWYVSAGASAAQLTDGRIVVAYGEEGSPLEGDTPNSQSGIHVLILNSDGTLAKGPFLGNPDAQSLAQFEPNVFALADGGFAISFESDDIVDNLTTQYRIQLFDSTGTPVGPSYHPEAYTLSGPEARGQQQSIILPDGSGLVIDIMGGSTVIQIGDGIVAGNTPPVTEGYTGTAVQGTPFSGQLIATDADGDPLTFVETLAPAVNDNGAIVGSAVIRADGSFTFTPGFPGISPLGTARFQYTVSDGINSGITGTAIFTVTEAPAPTNTPPTLAAITLGGTEDRTITGQANASDADHDALTYALGGAAAAHGTASISDSGAISYVPDADFFGSDSFEITVSDGTNAPVTAMVTVNVAGVQDAPVAQDATETVISVNTLTAALEAFDADGDTLVFALESGAAHGEVTIAEDGTATYIADAGFSGSDSFVFRVSDGTDSDTGTVSVTVDAAEPPASTVTTLADLAGASFQSLANGGRITITDARNLSAADLEVDPATGTVTFGGVQFHVAGDLQSRSFVVAEAAGGGYDLVLLDELLGDGADLSEGSRVAASEVNGVGPESFFTGNGTRDFTVTLDAARSGYNNAVGTYVRNPDGSISDVQVLFANTNAAGPGASATLTNIADDAVLEFFFIQNGASAAGGLGANLSISADGLLAEDGLNTGLTSYFSEASLNRDGTEHFLSGAVDGGGSLRVGIEDLTGGGDQDFQDMVFTVSWTDDGI
ncbi:Ig-like domain-containing protein [Sagittula sp. S175]|uniref:Ig-like domain-containing protein n=1 Tax=Sagittula sp. S175 TaxID=3415129 RepID=UPI003C7E3514